MNTQQLQETALAVMSRLDRGELLYQNERQVLRAALEAAVQEAEAKQVIEDWLKSHGDNELHLLWGVNGVVISPENNGQDFGHVKGGDTTEALIKCGAWCRAEVAK